MALVRSALIINMCGLEEMDVSKAGELLDNLHENRLAFTVEQIFQRAAYLNWTQLGEAGAGLSRIQGFIASRTPFAIISAWRQANQEYRGLVPVPKAENERNTASLVSDLRSLGYGATPLTGWYKEQEQDEVQPEVSLFVPCVADRGCDPNKFRKQMLDLGRKYRQEEIILADGLQIVRIDRAGNVIQSFARGQYNLKELTGFYSQIKNKPFRFVESAFCVGTVGVRAVWEDLGLVPDVEHRRIKEVLTQFSDSIRSSP